MVARPLAAFTEYPDWRSRCAVRPGGQSELKHGASGHVCTRPQAPTMPFNDRAANGQPQPQTIRLGREEGLEDVLQSLRREARTRIPHRDEEIAGICFAGANQQ